MFLSLRSGKPDQRFIKSEIKILVMKVEPRSIDILLGRGGNNCRHGGNQRLRKMAMTLAPIYAKMSKPDKADKINEVLETLLHQDPPVRFLQCKRPLDEAKYWEVADKKTSREKVSQDLRDAVNKRKPQQKKTPPGTFTKQKEDDSRLDRSSQHNLNHKKRETATKYLLNSASKRK